VERHDRAPVATFFVDAAFLIGKDVMLSEAASHHARVKRLVEGDVVQLTDGAGRRAIGSIVSMNKKTTSVVIDSIEHVLAPRAIHLRVPIADRERMLWLAEKSTELGVASWQAVRFRRSASVSPRGEGDAFREKILARMISALEQSGGAWLPTALPESSVDALCATAHALPILLDVSGASLRSVTNNSAEREPTVLVGPEGGIEPAELSLLVEAGWHRARLAPNVLRFETAGIAAVAALRATEMQTPE
jgi:16S rRNA (uracil1498-N3)-methyltransferase